MKNSERIYLFIFAVVMAEIAMLVFGQSLTNLGTLTIKNILVWDARDTNATHYNVYVRRPLDANFLLIQRTTNRAWIPTTNLSGPMLVFVTGLEGTNESAPSHTVLVSFDNGSMKPTSNVMLLRVVTAMAREALPVVTNQPFGIISATNPPPVP